MYLLGNGIHETEGRFSCFSINEQNVEEGIIDNLLKKVSNSKFL